MESTTHKPKKEATTVASFRKAFHRTFSNELLGSRTFQSEYDLTRPERHILFYLVFSLHSYKPVDLSYNPRMHFNSNYGTFRIEGQTLCVTLLNIKKNKKKKKKC